MKIIISLNTSLNRIWLENELVKPVLKLRRTAVRNVRLSVIAVTLRYTLFLLFILCHSIREIYALRYWKLLHEKLQKMFMRSRSPVVRITLVFKSSLFDICCWRDFFSDIKIQKKNAFNSIIFYGLYYPGNSNLLIWYENMTCTFIQNNLM